MEVRATSESEMSQMRRAAVAELLACERRILDLSSLPLDDPMSLHRVSSVTHDLCSAIVRAERCAVPRAEIEAHLAAIRPVYGLSPFVGRLQSWPRGYEGDFETIDYLMRAENRACRGTQAYWIQQFCLSSPMAQQHRNKVAAQAALIEHCARQAGDGARILILAAGGAPDVRLAAPVLHERRCHVVLNDLAPEALIFARLQTQEIGDRIQTVAGNTLTSVTRLARLGPYDLALAGGLFDYLPNRHGRFLVSQVVKRLLARRGCFFFTNIAHGNPYRPLIEYLGAWRLIERTREEIEQLLDPDMPEVELRVSRDATGLTLLATLQLKKQIRST